MGYQTLCVDRAEVDLQCGAASFSEGSDIHHDLEDSLLHLVNSVDIKSKIPYTWTHQNGLLIINYAGL